MSAQPRALARRVAQVLTAGVVVAGGVAVVASPAHAAVPTITSVSVAGSATNKVVTTGTTVVITGTGFTGMVDNATGRTGIVGGAANDAACDVLTAIPLGCSQVRFVGVGATAANFTAATAYVVASDTVIYATVPDAIPVNTGAVNASPALYSGRMLVQVVNTAVAGMGLSASTASDVYYRHALVATVTTPPQANPLGGGTLAVGVQALVSAAPVAYTLFSAVSTAPVVAPATNFSTEKITAYVVSAVAGSPTVASAAVTYNTTTTVKVTVPPGTPTDAAVGVMLVHDGILGSADPTALTYPAVITSMSTCGTTAPANFSTAVVACTGPASAPTAAGTYYVRVNGKGLTGATAWDFGTNTAATCVSINDAVANCTVVVSGTPDDVAAVTFTPGNPPGPGGIPAVGTTAGSIFVFTNVI